MSLSTIDEAEKKDSLNIPEILADFFLKKIDMPSYSDDSDHKHKSKRKKSKHKKRKHKKSKHRREYDSSDSLAESPDLKSKVLVDDVSSSEEIGIKRLKKIKTMKLQSVNNTVLQTVHQNNDQEMKSKSDISNSSSKTLEFYGPSIDLMLLGTEPTCSSKNDVITNVSSGDSKDMDKNDNLNEKENASKNNCELNPSKQNDIVLSSDLSVPLPIKSNEILQKDIDNVSVYGENNEVQVDKNVDNEIDFLEITCGIQKESVSEKTDLKQNCEGDKKLESSSKPNDSHPVVKHKSVGKEKKHSRSHSRSKSHSRHRSPKSKHRRKSRSSSRDSHHSHRKGRKRSHSHSRERSCDYKRRSRSRSRYEKRKKHSRSRSRSRVRRNHRKSRSKSQGDKRSRSKSRGDKRSRSKSRGDKRSRSKSRGDKRSRSKSRGDKRSRSKSRGDKRSRSKNRWDKRSQKHSDSRRRRKSYSRDRESSLSKSRHKSRSRRRTSRSRSRSKSRHRQSSHSQEKSHSRSRSKEKKSSSTKIDQAKILETARKNVLKMMKSGTLPEGLPVENIKKEQLISIQSGGKSVQELTDFCQRLSQKENEPEDNDDKEDKPDDETGFIHHPFKVKEPGMIKLNIKNAVQLPIKTHAQKVAETARLSSQFPVSSGNQHKQKELEWIPVVPDSSKNETKPVKTQPVIPTAPVPTIPVTTAASNQTVQVLPETPVSPPVSSIPMPISYPSSSSVASVVQTPMVTSPLPPPPLPPIMEPPVHQPFYQMPAQPVMPPYMMFNQNLVNSNTATTQLELPTASVFKPPKKLDIPSIVAKRFQALTKLQQDPNDPDALKTIQDAQKSIQEWVESQQVPGLFTGSTDAKMLTAAELCGPKYHKIRKDIFSHAPPVTEGKGMSLLKKMGWNPGEGLGKNNEGSLEPLMLDIKLDKKGLVSEGENSKKGTNSFIKELQGKHPVSALMELCSKRRWKPPLYTCVMDNGPPHKKLFCFKVEVNGVEYQPVNPCSNKKVAKADSAVLCLQSLNILSKAV